MFFTQEMIYFIMDDYASGDETFKERITPRKGGNQMNCTKRAFSPCG